MWPEEKSHEIFGAKSWSLLNFTNDIYRKLYLDQKPVRSNQNQNQIIRSRDDSDQISYSDQKMESTINKSITCQYNWSKLILNFSLVTERI